MIGNCVDCGRYVTIKGRRLCDRCYTQHKGDQSLYEFPTTNERRLECPPVCVCANPQVERLKYWNGAQCSQCGKPITDERMRDLNL
jgi:hypothetical protein